MIVLSVHPGGGYILKTVFEDAILKITINLKPMKSYLAWTPVFILATLLYPYSDAAAQSCTSTAGANNGGSFSTMALGGSTFVWNNPTNAQNADGSYATAGTTLGLSSTAWSNYLVVQNFGFSIPSTATICEIIVDIQRSETGLALGADVTDKSVRLLQNGALYGNDLATSSSWPSSDGTVTYGNTLLASSWGGSWQPADVNSANFGVAISTKLSTALVSLALQGKVNQIRVTIIFDPNSILAITLGKFSAARSPDGDGHLLSWKADPTAGGKFIVQLSANSSDWQDIATVPVTATSSEHDLLGSGPMSSYTYTDHNPLDGANYYRLHMVSGNGKSTYSIINEVTMENQTTIRCWPNPCVRTINVSSPHPVTRITLKDLQGRTLYMRQAAAPASDWQIPTEGLPPGYYFIQVGSETLRVLKTLN